MELKLDREKGHYWERKKADGKGIEVSQYFGFKDTAEMAQKKDLIEWRTPHPNPLPQGAREKTKEA